MCVRDIYIRMSIYIRDIYIPRYIFWLQGTSAWNLVTQVRSRHETRTRLGRDSDAHVARQDSDRPG